MPILPILKNNCNGAIPEKTDVLSEDIKEIIFTKDSRDIVLITNSDEKIYLNSVFYYNLEAIGDMLKREWKMSFSTNFKALTYSFEKNGILTIPIH